MSLVLCNRCHNHVPPGHVCPMDVLATPLPQPGGVFNSKADYVTRQGQTRAHTCHWPNCDNQVPPAMWGCKPHWFLLPKPIRDRIWHAYRPGQEIDMNPSIEYLNAAAAAQKWIKAHYEITKR